MMMVRKKKHRADFMIVHQLPETASFMPPASHEKMFAASFFPATSERDNKKQTKKSVFDIASVRGRVYPLLITRSQPFKQPAVSI